MSGAARERVIGPRPKEGEHPPAARPGPPPDLVALARSLSSNAAVQRLAAIARAPVEAPAGAYDSVGELLTAIGGAEEKPPYTSAKYQRAVKFLDVAGYDQIQEVFRGLEQRGGFKRLLDWLPFGEGVNWKRIKLAMLAWKERNRSSRVAFEIAHRAEVAALSPLDRATFLDWLGLESADVTQLKGTAGFQAMSQREQDRLLVYVGGSTSVSDAAPAALNTLLHDPTAKLDQAATFNTFLRAQTGLGQLMHATTDPRLPDWERLEGPKEVKNFKFASGRADALRYDASIGAGSVSKIPIYLPKTFTATGLFIPTVQDVVDILSRGPEQVRRMVKEVHVNPGRNPSDAYWARQPGYSSVANFRSYMTAGADGIVDIYPSTSAHNAGTGRTSIAHESGHTVSQKLWGTNTSNTKWKPWRDAMASDAISASTYARSSPDEDFAESWALFMEVRHGPREEELRMLFPARWAILATLW
jgi:hypothetical protein